MRRVVWSKDALDEFRGAVEYISQDNPRAALHVAERIDEAINLLAAMPSG